MPMPAEESLDIHLASLRRGARLSVEEVCQRTKIHPRHVEALENGRWGEVPSNTHLRAFSLALAQACGGDLDRTAVLVRRLLAATAPAAEALPASRSFDTPAPAPAAPAAAAAPSRAGLASASERLRRLPLLGLLGGLAALGALSYAAFWGWDAWSHRGAPAAESADQASGPEKPGALALSPTAEAKGSPGPASAKAASPAGLSPAAKAALSPLPQAKLSPTMAAGAQAASALQTPARATPAAKASPTAQAAVKPSPTAQASAKAAPTAQPAAKASPQPTAKLTSAAKASPVAPAAARGSGAASAQASPVAKATAQPASGAAGSAGGAELRVYARRACWLVLEVDGQRLPTVTLDGEGDTNRQRRWSVKRRAVLLAGNLGAIRLWWDGKNLGYLGEIGERANGLVFEPGREYRRDKAAALPLPPGVE